MIAVTWNSNPAWLLDDILTYTVKPQVSVKIIKHIEQGLSGIETRRVIGDTIRVSMKFTCLLNSELAIANLRNSLQSLQDEPILCPFWPAMFAGEETPTVASSYYVEIGDFAAPTIIAAAALPVARQACPLMVGVLKARPVPTLVVDGMQTIEYDFEEANDLYLTPPTFSPLGTLPANNGDRPLFPWPANWREHPSAGASDKDIERKPIAKTRTLADAFYTQSARRSLAQNFTLTNNVDVWNLISLFQSIGVNNFWLPGGIADATLTANVASTDTTLSVDAASNLGSNTYLCLINPINRVPVSVTSVVGNTLHLSGAVGTAFLAASTRLESLFLARFASDTLELTFSNTGWANCRINFTEVPYEVSGVEGETIGTTFGPMPLSAYLVTFSIAYPGGSSVVYLTDFERDLTYGGHTYTHFEIDTGDITETDKLERQSLHITSRNAASNPLITLAPFALEYPLMVSISEVDITASAASNPKVVFYGEVTELDTDGPYFDATCESMSYIFDRQVPLRAYQTNCNWTLFSSQCTLLAANWTWDAKVVSWDGASELVINTITSSNGATLSENFFAIGCVTITIGDVTQNRMVVSSTAVSAGEVTLVLSAPLNGTISASDALSVTPGCDGLTSTCIGVFDNFNNFGGFPFVPVANPTIFQTESINSGKKGNGT